ncbi:MAG TPA: undecaprenyldiphospho-muramoylpentapeptide beta-N-acetylglucosaminyltransferase [Leucothrix mucor]|uniref:UDP-N-acetylglucosamine--N-acetylmuramyl-(pentapeptide) pyrophosphoryl-undecaprenol N-acetylglucosamine transferase n=1 Tax=Leucothrix mucor TaxID=45248 RepID=A0A7V2WUQ4_LEUMU|nr:undecaprenyldiphospho-muramoylpentapeptide beta-N-acetylglucosaminyltransferase [Leucothrix mucor]
MNDKRPILITAGGTGGHVYPGLAVARALIKQDIPVVWMGTHKGLEARVIPAAGIEMAWLDVNGLRGKGLMTLLAAPVKLIKALFQSIGIMRKHRPVAVLGMGGFVAGPGGLVASLMGIPVVIHEQNAVAGLTNKLLSKFSKKILEGFPQTFPKSATATKQNKIIAIGNPVRKEITAIAPPEKRLAGRDSAIRLLIIGGSLGAQALNEIVPQALAELGENIRPKVRHQAGKGKDATTQADYKAVGVDALVTPFIEDMSEAYEWADLIICRAGALTIAEVAAAGLASILVPYPYAVDDHQTANGAYLSDNGAAILMQQTEFNKDSASKVLQSLLTDREKIVSMSIKARKLAKPTATDEVAAICAQLAGYDFNKNTANSKEETI